MRPDYVSAADQHGLKIPNLRRLWNTGAHAHGVRGVLPTVTYPSHTTIVTGVVPAKHGILANTTFDPLAKNQDGWYWYSEDIRVPTLWEVAARAGYVTGSVSWPVTAGAHGIPWLIPEYWRAQTTEDVKLLRLLSTPGMMKELEATVGPYTTDLSEAIQGDQSRMRYAEEIIRRKHARFMLVHLAALDHLEHSFGPFSSEANAALEEIDGMVGRLERAMRANTANAAVCVVSDHGFASIDHQLNLRAAFVNAGLISLDGATPPKVRDWEADAWDSGGTAYIMLRNPRDAKSRAAVKNLLNRLAADLSNGIDQIMTQQSLVAMGGAPNAVFAVTLKPGYSLGGALEGPVLRKIRPGGTHGYAPTQPDMLASFLISGEGIAANLDFGNIDMRSIAPTLARYLGVSLPTAELTYLDLNPPRQAGRQ